MRAFDFPVKTPDLSLVLQQYRPVKILYLVGVQTAEALWASVHLIPPAANRSM